MSPTGRFWPQVVAPPVEFEGAAAREYVDRISGHGGPTRTWDVQALLEMLLATIQGSPW